MSKAFEVIFAAWMIVCVAGGACAQTREDALRLHREAYAIRQKARSNEDLKKAVEKFEEALAIYLKVGDAKNAGRVYNSLGLVYKNWGQYDKAIEFYDKALAMSKQGPDPKVEGWVLNNLGEIQRETSQYAKAIEFYEKSLAITRKIGDVQTEGRTLNNLGLVYKNLGQYDKAIEFYDKALAINRKVSDTKMEGRTLNNLGEVRREMGQYAKAVQFYQKSLAISKKVGDVQMQGRTLNNLGLVYKSWGQYAKAVEFYEKSLAIAGEISDVWMEGRILNNLGIVYTDWGQYSKAVDFYERSLANSRKISDVQMEGRTLNNLGLVYVAWGQYGKAVKFFEESLVIKKKIGDVRAEGSTVMNLGKVYEGRGEYANALKNYQEGLAIFTRIKVRTNWPKDLIGNLYLDQGDLTQAETYIKAAHFSASLGRLSLAKSDYPHAKACYEKLLSAAEKSKNANGLFTAYTGLGKVHEAMEDYKAAEEYYEKGMQRSEEIRSSILPAERKNFFDVKINGFDRSEPARGLTRVRMKMNKGIQSIDSSEVTRARSFSDHISQRSDAGFSGVPKDVLEKEENLVTKVASLKKELAKTDKEKQPGRYEIFQKQAQEADQQLQAFVDMLWNKYKRYAAVKYPRPVTLKESSLKPQEFVVMFDVSGEGVGVKLIHGKEIAETYYKKWKLANLRSAVKKFRRPFEDAKLESFDVETGKTLYRNLLGAVLLQVPEGSPLIIIPDGILAVLPFEALVISGKPTWNPDDLRPHPQGLTYLGDVYPVSYYQSISTLTLSRALSANATKGTKSLVVADPIFEPDDARLKSADTAERQKPMAALPQKLMSIKRHTGLRFDRLALTRELGEYLKKLDPGRTDVFTGLNAKKSLFFDKNLTNYRSIVLATHGYFGNDIPGIREPVVVMSLVDQPKEQDGFLTMTEVMGMKLNADVVALTACQTGIGNNLSGEGVMSMGRAFQYAGAKSILMTLWSVSEQASVLLVERFFAHLQQGENKLEALKSARQDVRNAGYEHPFYWAPFILVGEVN